MMPLRAAARTRHRAGSPGPGTCAAHVPICEPVSTSATFPERAHRTTRTSSTFGLRQGAVRPGTSLNEVVQEAQSRMKMKPGRKTNTTTTSSVSWLPLTLRFALQGLQGKRQLLILSPLPPASRLSGDLRVVVVEASSGFHAKPSFVNVLPEQLSWLFWQTPAQAGVMLFDRQNYVQTDLVHNAKRPAATAADKLEEIIDLFRCRDAFSDNVQRLPLHRCPHPTEDQAHPLCSHGGWSQSILWKLLH